MSTADQAEVHKAAQRMVDRFGGRALDEVNLRMVELSAAGQEDALHLWSAIRDGVEAILTISPGKPN